MMEFYPCITLCILLQLGFFLGQINEFKEFWEHHELFHKVEGGHLLAVIRILIVGASSNFEHFRFDLVFNLVKLQSVRFSHCNPSGVVEYMAFINYLIDNFSLSLGNCSDLFITQHHHSAGIVILVHQCHEEWTVNIFIR